MKIAYFTTDISTKNGWGRYSYEILRRLADYDIKPIIFTSRYADKTHPGFTIQPLLSSESDKWYKGFRMISDWQNVKGLLGDVQLIHCLTEPFAPLGAFLSKNKPLVLSIHGTYSLSTMATKWSRFYKHAYERADAIFSVSNYTACQVIKKMPNLADKIKAVPLGVNARDVDEASINPAAERENAFLMVGHVKPRKGTLEAVKAMKYVVQRFPSTKLYIVGSLSDRKYVEQVNSAIDTLEIQNNVIWVGSVDEQELHSYYNRVKGLVMPSRNVGSSFEGFGLVHLEANSFGVPTIGSLDCGNEDAIKDGYSGYLIKQGDIKHLSEAMIRLLEPTFDWDTMSHNARSFAYEMSWDRLVDKYVEVYRTLAVNR